MLDSAMDTLTCRGEAESRRTLTARGRRLKPVPGGGAGGVEPSLAWTDLVAVVRYSYEKIHTRSEARDHGCAGHHYGGGSGSQRAGARRSCRLAEAGRS